MMSQAADAAEKNKAINQQRMMRKRDLERQWNKNIQTLGSTPGRPPGGLSGSETFSADWLPPINEHRSVRSVHSGIQQAIVNLDCFKELDAAARNPLNRTSLQASALDIWNSRISNDRNSLKRFLPDVEHGPPRLITSDGGRDLQWFAEVLGDYVFQGQLRQKIVFKWERHLPGAFGRTRETARPGVWLVEMLDSSDLGVGFLSGDRAIKVLSTLLHEMLHVFIEYHESDDQQWGSTAMQFQCERSGHGNAWLEKALQLQAEANRAFAVKGCRWDLNVKASFKQERRFGCVKGEKRFRDATDAVVDMAKRSTAGEAITTAVMAMAEARRFRNVPAQLKRQRPGRVGNGLP